MILAGRRATRRQHVGGPPEPQKEPNRTAAEGRRRRQDHPAKSRDEPPRIRGWTTHTASPPKAVEYTGADIARRASDRNRPAYAGVNQCQGSGRDSSDHNPAAAGMHRGDEGRRTAGRERGGKKARAPQGGTTTVAGMPPAAHETSRRDAPAQAGRTGTTHRPRRPAAAARTAHPAAASERRAAAANAASAAAG